MDYKHAYYDKVQQIVKNKIKTERIKFKGKMITREVIKKEWNIPDVITTDIGFQLMFGFKSPSVINNSQSSLKEIYLDDLKLKK
tara:strand:+ start:3809 stop:4060 length:252 start_codon:yes stop_codon:yes gene_type:complete